MLPEESLNNDRNKARSYLERTATVHWLTPGFRRIMDWNETSGFGAVEAGRAAIGHEEMVSGYSAIGHEASAAMGLSWDAKSGYGSVETSRAEISALVAPVAAPSWDQTSGYGVVEASRATIGHPATGATQVPADVRWAPESPFAGSQAPTSEAIPAPLASVRRTETAHQATVPLPHDPLRATSGNQIAYLLFGEASRSYGSQDVTRTQR